MELATKVPVFPLPEFFLFPGNAAPLHIFEERYRQMIDDLMDQAGRLVMAPIPRTRPGDPDGPPPLGTHGCLVEIIRHEKLADGRFLILVAGLARVRIREVEGDRLYRMTEAEVVGDVPCPEMEEDLLRPHLEKAVTKLGGQRLELPESLNVGVLADILLQQLDLDPARLWDMLIEPDAGNRARAALQWYREMPA